MTSTDKLALPEQQAADAGTEPWLAFSGISKHFGMHTALQGIDLRVRKGEFLCLLGPSGCGKTTLLRILAGLESHDAGSISLAGRDISHLPPARRDYGIVFQSYALFPNLTVAANIAYGLRTGRDAKRRRVSELLDLVGLGGTEHKYPSQLSGGQQQRVALARALATSPSMLLLDEPLSALDAKVREHLRSELRLLQQKLGITTLMVTHDQEEALALADTIAVMHAGRIEQVGTPAEIYGQPASRFVADFIGKANWLDVVRQDGRLQHRDSGLDLGTDTLPDAHLSAGQAGQLCVRPEDVALATSADAGKPLAAIERIEFLGNIRRITLAVRGGQGLRLTADLCANDPVLALLAPGQFVSIDLSTTRAQWFGAQS
jgi:iron(III) transport system ATP-binding protein